MTKLTFRRAKVLLFIIMLLAIQLTDTHTVNAADTDKVLRYGVIIADEKGSYSYYDMKNWEGSSLIETASNNTVMIPLKSLVKLIPGLSYKYDKVMKTATVSNSKNGKKIIYKLNSKNLSYYSSKNAKAAVKTIAYKVYASGTGSTVLVPMSSFQWILNSTSGYKYYSTSNMQSAGYDTYDYSGLIIYNPYKTVTSIPKSTTVKGITSTVKVTIPEGYSVAQIFDLLVKKGVCSTTDTLYDSMANYDFSKYPLVNEIVTNNKRCFKLEGYLYPDTYEFYRLSKPENVIGKFLRNTEARITPAFRTKAAEMGYSIDQILTVASIIEKETGKNSMMPTISSVLYNRLDSKMKIQCDSTIYYVERYIKPYISGDINRYNSYYNTYKCAALPAGPICNPGISAIKAALYPETTDYLYFYSDSNGEYHFSHDYVNPNATDSTGNSNTDDAGNSDNTGGTNDNSTSSN